MSYKKINIIIILILIITVIFRFYFAFYNNNRKIFIEKYINQNSEKDTGMNTKTGTTKSFEILGFIDNEPQIKDFNQSFILKTEKINNEFVEINIKVTADRYIEYEYGQKLKLNGKLSQPFNFKSNGGRTFDYINYLLKDGIYFEIKKPKIEIIENSVDSENTKSLIGKVKNIFNSKAISKNLFKIKKRFLENIKKVLGEPHAALAGGLVVGEKSALGNDLINDFRKAGLIHIVVLSGYNITIVAESIRRMLSFLPRNISLWLGGMGIIAFGILVGGGATVVRSCIMAIIAILATFLRKDYSVGKALFIAAMLMLIQNPLILLYDPSFQLSFIATFGLIILSSPIEKKLSFITEKFGIRGLVASTFATQIFISPYLLYMMGQLSIIGVIVNILVLPIIPLTMFFVSITGLLGFISIPFFYFISEITGWISHFFLSYELFIVKVSANLPFASINLPKFSFYIVIGFYIIYLIAFTKFSSIFSQFKFKKKSPT